MKMKTLSQVVAFTLISSMLGQSFALAKDPIRFARLTPEAQAMAEKWSDRFEEKFEKMSDERKLNLIERTQKRLLRSMAKIEKRSEEKHLARQNKLIKMVVKLGAAEAVSEEVALAEMNDHKVPANVNLPDEMNLNSDEKEILDVLGGPVGNVGSHTNGSAAQYTSVTFQAETKAETLRNIQSNLAELECAASELKGGENRYLRQYNYGSKHSGCNYGSKKHSKKYNLIWGAFMYAFFTTLLALSIYLLVTGLGAVVFCALMIAICAVAYGVAAYVFFIQPNRR